MFDVVQDTFRQACQTRVRIADTVREVQEHIRTKLSALPEDKDPAARHLDCEGFRQGLIDRRYYIHEASFKRWFDDHPGHYALLMKWLTDRGAFVEVVSHRFGASAKNAYSHTTKWPNGRMTRHVILRHEALLREPARVQQDDAH